MTSEARTVLRIDVWADLVCPWCFIGKKRLQRVLEEQGLSEQVELVHRAFQLDPSASAVSEPVADHLAAKYGVSRQQALSMMDDVTAVAAGEGLNYRLDLTTTGNTRDAHRLILWAQQQDPAAAQLLLTDLYSAYFERGECIFTVEELTPFAAAVGLDAAACRDLLLGDEFVDVVADDQAEAQAVGANGVPFFVFDSRVGFSGAQPEGVFAAALAQVMAGTTHG